MVCAREFCVRNEWHIILPSTLRPSMAISRQGLFTFVFINNSQLLLLRLILLSHQGSPYCSGHPGLARPLCWTASPESPAPTPEESASPIRSCSIPNGA